MDENEDKWVPARSVASFEHEIRELMGLKELPALSRSAIKRKKLMDECPRQFIGCARGYDLRDRIWGLNIQCEPLFKHFEDKYHSEDRAVVGASLLSNEQVYRPNIYAPNQKVVTLPTIAGMAAAAVFMDVLAEELFNHWDRGLFHYAWANPFKEHDRFNIPLELRKQIRKSNMAMAAKIAAHAIVENYPSPAFEENPSVAKLFKDVRDGKLAVSNSRGRPPKKRRDIEIEVGSDLRNEVQTLQGALLEQDRKLADCLNENRKLRENDEARAEENRMLQEKVGEQADESRKLLEKVEEQGEMIRDHSTWLTSLARDIGKADARSVTPEEARRIIKEVTDKWEKDHGFDPVSSPTPGFGSVPAPGPQLADDGPVGKVTEKPSDGAVAGKTLVELLAPGSAAVKGDAFV